MSNKDLNTLIVERRNIEELKKLIDNIGNNKKLAKEKRALLNVVNYRKGQKQLTPKQAEELINFIEKRDNIQPISKQRCIDAVNYYMYGYWIR